MTSDSSDVYEGSFRSIASLPSPSSAHDHPASDPPSSSSQIQPTLILLGIRLGPDRITPVYHSALKALLTYPQSIGIAGGRPSSSHYFVGVQGSTFFYLDPHETRPGLPYHADSASYTEEEIASVHTRKLRGLRVTEMDPSMLIGFLIRDEQDWEDWKKRVREDIGDGGKPIVRVYEGVPPGGGAAKEREGAVDEVETFDDESNDDEDTLTEVGV